MNTLIPSIIPIIISSISVIIIGISAILLWKQIRGNYRWNRKKTTQEILNNLIMGEFPCLGHTLEVEFKCVIWGDKSQTYEDVVKGLKKEEIDEIYKIVSRILNILEVVAINIKNDIIDDPICFDYLSVIMTGYYRWSKPFIFERREIKGSPKIFANFEDCAQRWTKIIKEEEMINRQKT